MIDIHHAARLLGGEVFGRRIRCPGPGHSLNDRSLSLKPSAKSPLGWVFHSFAGDDAIICLDYLRARLGLPAFKPGEHINQTVATPSPPEPNNNTDYAKQLWHESEPILGSLAEKYLYEFRGLSLDGTFNWHRVLRFHRKCRYQGQNHAALIALYRDVLTDEPKAIQRTFLTREGRKIGRAMLGPTKGCAIKIDPASSVSTALAIGEGLETVLSGRAMGFFPAWAVGSAGAIANFPVLPGVEKLRIFAETKDHGANEKAAFACKALWIEAGRKGSVIRPRDGCGDLNDEWVKFKASPDDFLETCQRFWPGAELARREGPSVRSELKRIGLAAFGIGGGDGA